MGAKRKTLLATVGIVLVIPAITAYIATLPSAETHRAPVARVTTPPGAPEDVAAQAQAENSYDSSEKAFGVADRSAHAKDTPAAGFASGSSPAGRGASSEEQDFLAKSNARDLVSQIEACA